MELGTPSRRCVTCAGEGRGPERLLVPGWDEAGGHRPSQPVGHLRGHGQEGEHQKQLLDLVQIQVVVQVQDWVQGVLLVLVWLWSLLSRSWPTAT